MGKTLVGLGLLLVLAGCGDPLPPEPQRQCNPDFDRGDAVQFRALPGSRYVVRYMRPYDCSALINDAQLNAEWIGIDLLEKAP